MWIMPDDAEWYLDLLKIISFASEYWMMIITPNIVFEKEIDQMAWKHDKKHTQKMLMITMMKLMMVTTTETESNK